MSEDQAQPRSLTPFMKFSKPGPTFKDLTPHVVPSDDEVEEVEEAITPAPKDSSAQESATSSESQQTTVQQPSETPVHPEAPTDRLEAAVRANGKDSDENEDEPASQSATTPPVVTSLPSSSSPTSPGKPTPPASAKPPTAS